jgi:hypothetical protein
MRIEERVSTLSQINLLSPLQLVEIAVDFLFASCARWSFAA